MATSSPEPAKDIASMSAAKSKERNAPPTKHRDGFHLIPATPIHYEHDLTKTPTHSFSDITYKVSTSDSCARIAFNRPEVLHSFRPRTINEVRQALDFAREDIRVAVVLLTSETSPSSLHTPSFCAGGDQTVRSNDGGYDDGTEEAPRLRVLDLQIQMRRCPKPIVAVVRGYAIGGGHILHMVSDLTLASSNAVFGQTGPRMGSFDAGYGSTHMARLLGQKKAKEMWFLCRFYDAREAKRMGLINEVFEDSDLDGGVAQWVRRMVMNSPTALACIKAAMNCDEDGSAGNALLAGHATRLFYLSEESQEGRNAFLQGRAARFRELPSSRL
eukprot:CAMPEP_0172510452 /NCGR_PEP_ID=MMETSP1066-20121228/228562_1 /TAXON_ID=671091 /ORGANISM="Coscinodiscus wailesii, Strain CCMP2513" /LENGTH=328 /DNA_ID=CAMNT_0013289389 /DNA_START=44 /DNA_END=1030 /DNA_ORIENTATION=-